MKILFLNLLAIFITAVLAAGQTITENSLERANDKSDSTKIKNVGSVRTETQAFEKPATAESSITAMRAIELNNQGILLTLKKDYSNALKYFRQADSLSPDNEQILFNLGTTLINLQRDHEAVEIFKKAVKIAPTSATIYNSLALALNNTGKTAESFAAFRRSLEITPDDPITLCNYANALHHAGQDVEALIIVNQAIKLPGGNFPASYNIRGTTLYNLKKYREAKADFELAYKLDPRNPDLLNNLGVIYSHEGKKKKAISYFLAAERLAPDWELIAYNLALNFAEIGNRQESDKYLLKLQNSNPKFAEELRKALLQKYVLEIPKVND